MKLFGGWVVLSLLALLLVPSVFAGFFSNMWNGITGQATSDTTTLSITISNTAPTVDSVNSSNTHASQSVTEAGVTNLTLWFTATDADGVANLNDSSARITINLSGEEQRNSTSCTVVDLDSDTANYTCNISIWYFDGAGSWSVNATVRDINGAEAENSTTHFTLLETTAMVMSPTALTWPALSLTDINQTSNNDPLLINNTANKDIANEFVNVTGYDLAGTTTATELINAANFTVHTADNCNGVAMANATSLNITGASIPAGNNSAGQGQEQLYFCLLGLNNGLSAQTYDTSKHGQWLIQVT